MTDNPARAVNLMLRHGLSADELPDQGLTPAVIETALCWIETHPTATAAGVCLCGAPVPTQEATCGECAV